MKELIQNLIYVIPLLTIPPILVSTNSYYSGNEIALATPYFYELHNSLNIYQILEKVNEKLISNRLSDKDKFIIMD